MTTDWNEGGVDMFGDMALEPDGRIVTVGAAEFPIPEFFALAVARYEPDGSLDASFGWGGISMRPEWGNGFGSGVALQADGRIVVAGVPDFSVGRLIADCGDGIVDPGEGCDDGNVVDGDCCSSDMRVGSRRRPVHRLRCLHDRRDVQRRRLRLAGRLRSVRDMRLRGRLRRGAEAGRHVQVVDSPRRSLAAARRVVRLPRSAALGSGATAKGPSRPTSAIRSPDRATPSASSTSPPRRRA